ncbi:uncharacterized protein LACBIDRAFT_324521 [Laccaria bicolor S238N-H82]|uniref:Predicted protein n=1 Tax=Laccaria bicolor (strain S238N-H82 / ATCC MYA-4686) TaxID=486041 RepID=B0D257_LACBS|nr:uncharacterized protein LACBIDRAFT_324521 [Laccaria bicolor S238N-H82]EDR10687.1 predicted protein [Laccaria bicolor S238N-H82]|eukprot:XP_001877988.1 predicted protein [Laccaria bicolor S238N-H82]
MPLCNDLNSLVLLTLILACSIIKSLPKFKLVLSIFAFYGPEKSSMESCCRWIHAEEKYGGPSVRRWPHCKGGPFVTTLALAWLRALRLGSCQEVWIPARVQRGYQIDSLWKGAISDWFGACGIPWTVDDTTPEVFFGISATVVLSVPVITLAGVGFLLVFLIKAFHPLIGSYRLSAGPRTSFINILFVNIYITFCFVVQWIYVVVTIEQTIQRNPVIHNGPRFPITFGQIFPVVTIGACLVSIYNDLQES